MAPNSKNANASKTNTKTKAEDKAFWVGNVESLSLKNNHFRSVLYTAPDMQLVLMCLKPGESIGEEVHEEGDQFIRVEAGSARFVLDGAKRTAHAGFACVIPRGVTHDVVNIGKEEDLKLYVLYTPPEHAPGTQVKRKEDAEPHDH